MSVITGMYEPDVPRQKELIEEFIAYAYGEIKLQGWFIVKNDLVRKHGTNPFDGRPRPTLDEYKEKFQESEDKTIANFIIPEITSLGWMDAWAKEYHPEIILYCQIPLFEFLEENKKKGIRWVKKVIEDYEICLK